MTPRQRLVLLVALPIVMVGLLEVPGLAQDEVTEQAVIGTLSYEDPDSGDRVPVADVEVSVVEGGSGISDAEGNFTIPIEEPGSYEIVLNEETLPEGVTLRNPDSTSVQRVIEAGQDGRVLFALVLGEGGGGFATGSKYSFRRVAQLTVEGLKQGLYLAMAAIGLSLIFGTTGLTNFAHAEMVTWGMLTTYFFNFYGLAGMIGFLAAWPEPFGDGTHLVGAAILGMMAGGAIGYVLDRFIFKSARRVGVSLIAQMVMTIGLSIMLRYLYLYNFGGSPRTFGNFAAQRAWDLGPIDLTPKDLTAMLLSVGILVMIGMYLQLTRMGKAMRAVADNRELAESTGIDVQMVISRVWIAGGALAALGGVFFGLDQVKWDFGFRILLLIFAAVTLGGLGTAYGALVGALVVGLAINLSTIEIDAELKNMVALLVLVLILLVRPQGLLGRRERIG